MVRAGGIGTLVFGIWLAIRLDHVQIWSGWIIAAIVLWAVAVGAGSRSGAEYERAMRKAEELEAAGQTGSNADLLALEPHPARARAPHDRDRRRLPDPDRHDLEAGRERPREASRPDGWNIPLLVHVTGAMILVGGMLGAAAGSRARARRRAQAQARLLLASVRRVPRAGPHEGRRDGDLVEVLDAQLRRRGLPAQRRSRWIEIGGTALDGGGGLARPAPHPRLVSASGASTEGPISSQRCRSSGSGPARRSSSSPRSSRSSSSPPTSSPSGR